MQKNINGLMKSVIIKFSKWINYHYKIKNYFFFFIKKKEYFFFFFLSNKFDYILFLNREVKYIIVEFLSIIFDIYIFFIGNFNRLSIKEKKK